MNKRSRMYPSVRVDRANVPAVGQAGGVLLTRTVEASGLGLVLSQALGLWRKPLAKHDPARCCWTWPCHWCWAGIPAVTPPYYAANPESTGSLGGCGHLCVKTSEDRRRTL